MIFQPIALGIVIPDVTPEITRTRAYLKYMTIAKLFFSLNILRMHNRYTFRRFGIIPLFPAPWPVSELK